MKQTLTKDMFRFQMNQIRPNNFSYEGLGELFDYFELCEGSSGEEMEFDPIAICCDFSQCSLKEFIEAFPSVEVDYNGNNWEEMKDAIQDYIEHDGFWFAFVEDGKEIVFENF